MPTTLLFHPEKGPVAIRTLSDVTTSQKLCLEFQTGLAEQLSKEQNVCPSYFSDTLCNSYFFSFSFRSLHLSSSKLAFSASAATAITLFLFPLAKTGRNLWHCFRLIVTSDKVLTAAGLSAGRYKIVGIKKLLILTHFPS